MTRFSVIIATRNRPALFYQALESVLTQADADFEVLAVNDGSDTVHTDAYRAIFEEIGDRIRVIELVRRPNGHGQSYALNTGAEHARGEYLCFLDDDDFWIDPGHLHRAGQAVGLAGELDLYLSNQVAWRDGAPLQQTVWIEDLLACVPDLPGPDGAGCHVVTPPALLRAHGFCHLNTLVIRRALFLEMGGLDEGMRYENDRDFYLRAIDRAEVIRYAPFTVSRHNVPVPARNASMSTIVPTLGKRLYQLGLLDKLMISARRPEIRRYARRHKAYTLQHLAQELARTGSHGAAALYAREALALRPSPRGLAMTVLYGARSCRP